MSRSLRKRDRDAKRKQSVEMVQERRKPLAASALPASTSSGPDQAARCPSEGADFKRFGTALVYFIFSPPRVAAPAFWQGTAPSLDLVTPHRYRLLPLLVRTGDAELPPVPAVPQSLPCFPPPSRPRLPPGSASRLRFLQGPRGQPEPRP